MVQQCFLSLKNSKKLFSTVNSFNDKCKSCCENRKIICFIYCKCNEDMNDIIKIRKSLEDSSVLIDGVTGTVKDEIKKKQEGIFLGALLAPLSTSFVQPIISLEVKGIKGGGDRRAGRGYMDKSS